MSHLIRVSISLVLFSFIISNLSAQIWSVGARLGVGLSDTYYNGDNSILLDGILIDPAEIFEPRRSISGSVSLEIKFDNPFALMFDSGLVTKGYQQETVSLTKMTYLHFQSSMSLRYYFLDKFHASAYYELSNIQRANYNNGLQTQNLVDFGLYDDVLEHSVGLGLGYRVADELDIGVKYIRGLTTIDSVILTDINGNQTGVWNEQSQYGQIYMTYYFYVNNWKGDLDKDRN